MASTDLLRVVVQLQYENDAIHREIAEERSLHAANEEVLATKIEKIAACTSRIDKCVIANSELGTMIEKSQASIELAGAEVKHLQMQLVHLQTLQASSTAATREECRNHDSMLLELRERRTKQDSGMLVLHPQSKELAAFEAEWLKRKSLIAEHHTTDAEVAAKSSDPLVSSAEEEAETTSTTREIEQMPACELAQSMDHLPATNTVADGSGDAPLTLSMLSIDNSKDQSGVYMALDVPANCTTESADCALERFSPTAMDDTVASLCQCAEEEQPVYMSSSVSDEAANPIGTDHATELEPISEATVTRSEEMAELAPEMAELAPEMAELAPENMEQVPSAEVAPVVEVLSTTDPAPAPGGMPRAETIPNEATPTMPTASHQLAASEQSTFAEALDLLKSPPAVRPIRAWSMFGGSGGASAMSISESADMPAFGVFSSARSTSVKPSGATSGFSMFQSSLPTLGFQLPLPQPLGLLPPSQQDASRESAQPIPSKRLF
ncbi:hypothetical protein CAOG_03420 [Capsaspora owczarzaki ATCC 30864]|uniref:hypothetical protein n=1 Tax=Capsaspora owczarzaki (strain ATCC 30864) TaxID=595528 RepID=UPI0003522F26|nr:hypothetical protein CAOG_03420 [Capsaspora owczarzaki ATCC 30864]|eukprot:XP_004364259.2 hypothetical protein CAOG_03420 [Capsaspora owczarzaki ATCC 30864]